MFQKLAAYLVVGVAAAGLAVIAGSVLMGAAQHVHLLVGRL
jgi:hypothetical protein